MATTQKICTYCGMTLTFGLANCNSCGAQVGTVFSETEFQPLGKPVQKRKAVNPDVERYEKIEKAKDRANNALVLSLSSFFIPLFGSVLVILAIVFGAFGLRTLLANRIEEGRGSAIAGLVIGVLGVIAQVGYLIYFLKITSWSTPG